MNRLDTKAKEERAVEVASRPEAEATYIPLVDIYQHRDDTVLEVELPGVDERSIEVNVENNVLTIEGRQKVEAPAGYRLAREEFRAGRFRREFELTHVVNQAEIRAVLRQGLLTLVLPKGEAAKARKIDITVQ